MALMNPAMSERNLTPSSTAPESASAGTAGTVELLQMLIGPVPAGTVVNDQKSDDAIALPGRSLAPLTVAVYVMAVPSAAEGVRVAVCVVSLYATLAATGLPLPSARINDSVPG